MHTNIYHQEYKIAFKNKKNKIDLKLSSKRRNIFNNLCEKNIAFDMLC